MAKAASRRAPKAPARRPGGRGRRARRRWPGVALWLVKWSATAAVWAAVVLGGVAAFYAYDLPDVDKALSATRRPTVTLLAADGSVLATVGDLYGPPVALGDLPPALPGAVLATEDRRFYGHFGLDPIGLARALVANARAGRIVQGGSTITQQVAKNLFLTPERTLKRKVQEVLLALWLEYKFTKDQILTLYLNRVYLGSGAFGVEAAARRYFAKSARGLDLYQSALLAGLLKAPSRYSPLANPDRAHRRAVQVLANMVNAGTITEKAAAAAKKQRSAAVPGRQGGGRYFADWVLEQVSGYVGGAPGDLRVVTTLRPHLQATAARQMAGLLDGDGARAGVSQAALVALSPDGAVRAMVGGRDYAKSQFNRVTQARRQPGSAFKPMVYLAALEAGLSPETPFIDEPVTVAGWTPRNFSRRHRGRVTLETALIQSINTVAVKVAERVGRSRVAATARRLGLSVRPDPRPSLALGTAEVSLLDLSAAYAPFANGGRGVWPYGIEAVLDAQGREIYRRAGSGPGRVVAASHVAEMNRMLSGVLTRGTGRAAELDRPAAGKTGTSQGFRDAWFIGYSAHLIAGVWMGNDDGRPMKNVTGGGLPARLWRDFMVSAHRETPPRPLPGLDGAPPAPDDEPGLWDKIVARFTGGEGMDGN